MMTARATIRAASRILLALTSVLLFVFAPNAAAQPGGSDPGSAPPAAVPAARQANKVAVITLRGEIDRWSELSVKRRLEQAEKSGADAVVIEVDSPGGEVGAVLEICNAIKGSTISNTVGWVHPDAYSGGAIVALACREIVTSSPASMGDAFPITFGPMGVRGLNPDERTKFLPPLLTEVADSARRNGYDEFLVQAMVVDGIELWSVRDRETGERWFINEAEYRVLFDGDPPRGKPVLTSVTGGRAADQSLAPRAGTPTLADESGEDEGGDGSPADAEVAASGDDGTPGDEGGVGEPAPSIAPSPSDEGTAFTPAAPGLADLTETISGTLRARSTRPTFTESDRGRYGEVSYITDGTGPIVLRDDQLRAFGFSTEIVQNDEELRAFFGAREMVRTEQSWSESLVR